MTGQLLVLLQQLHLFSLLQSELVKIFHNILVNADTREAALEYIAKVLERNAKRSQLQPDERLVAGDGFMLNLLGVLQQLSVKISIDKVDQFYPNHPRCRVNIKDEARLKCNSQDVVTWVENLGEQV